MPSFADYLVFINDLISSRRSSSEYRCSQTRQAEVSKYLDTSKSLRILDIANGNLRPQYEILKRQGHRVVGIDYVNYPRFSVTNLLYKIARSIFNFNLPISKIHHDSSLVFGDVGKLPFVDGSFDLVTSVAAFEHFLDVDSVVAEMYRVLAAGGIAWVFVHHFPSLSGGHNAAFQLDPIKKMPKNMIPWDHLREQKIPFTVPLNRLRPKDYISKLKKNFEILEWRLDGLEGTEFLDAPTRAILSEYSEDELTKPCLVIIARK